MTKLSTMIESLISIIDADDKGNICQYIINPERNLSSYCHEVFCRDCPFDPRNINQLEKHLKTIKTLELIDND